MSLLSTRSVTKIFEKRNGILGRENIIALDDVSVELNEREIVGIVGASGSGKSTLAKLLVLMYQPTSGQIYYRENPVNSRRNRVKKDYRRKVQMVFQDPYASLDPNHTVEWHIMRPLAISEYSGDRNRRIDELLEMVTLTPPAYYRNKFPYQLSGGQRQRVYLARALSLEPEIVIADEPVSMLDVSVRIEILDLINKLRNDLGISFFYISHDLNTVSFLTDRIYVIEKGKVVETGDTSMILNDPRTDYTKKLINAAPDPYKKIRASNNTASSQIDGREILNVSDLEAGYNTKDGFVDILKGLNFNVNRGEIFGIAGESGSGKSTAAQALFSMLDYPGEIKNGSVVVNGDNLFEYSENKLRSSMGKRMSYVPQAAMNSLNPVRRIRDQFLDLLAAHSVDPANHEERFLEKLSLVRLDKSVLDLYPHELSGGMRQRVVIAMTLLLNPELMIFDEPTTGLDVLVEYEILRDIKEIQNKLNLTVIFITHDLSVLFEIADRVSVLYGGEIVEIGTVDELLNDAQHPYTHLLIKSIPRIGISREEIARIPGVSLDFRKENKGCLFASRCPFNEPACSSMHPSLVPIEGGDNHLHRCHRAPAWKN